MRSFLSRSVLARVLPFVLFMVFLALRGHMPLAWADKLDPRWIYGISVCVVGACLLIFWRDYVELDKRLMPRRWDLALAVLVGVAVFVLWINLTEPWMMLGQPTAGFYPVDSEGRVEWALVAVRWLGATLLVPVMEELFWRSFLMRWVDNPLFEKVVPSTVTYKAMGLSTLVFMLAHTQWLAAIVAGLAYAWLYKRSGSLWPGVIAHAVTNGILGVWVVLFGNWQFW